MTALLACVVLFCGLVFVAIWRMGRLETLSTNFSIANLLKFSFDASSKRGRPAPPDSSDGNNVPPGSA
jgi:hypothetical protein